MTYVNITIEDLVTPLKDTKMKLIKFSGQLDESNVDENAKKIYKLIDVIDTKPLFIFDFSELEYMNSKSIGYLTDWYGKISAKEGKIVIIGAKENILDILQVVGLTQLIDNYSTVEEAKTALVK